MKRTARMKDQQADIEKQRETYKSTKNRANEIGKVSAMLSTIPDQELFEFIREVRTSKFIGKNMENIVSLLENRKLPESGLELAEIVNIGIRKFSTGE